MGSRVQESFEDLAGVSTHAIDLLGKLAQQLGEEFLKEHEEGQHRSMQERGG